MSAPVVGAYSSDEQLDRRLERTLAAAAGLVGSEPRDGDPIEILRDALVRIEAALALEAPDGAWRARVLAHGNELERLRSRYESRFESLENAERGLAVLRESTSPETILSSAAQVLCQHSRLQRAVLSLVKGGALVAEAVYFEGDAVGALKALQALQADPPRLAHPLIETELLRRRRATIVTDAQTHPRVHRPTARTLGWHTYVAVPLLLRGDLIGALHADGGDDPRPLDVLDGDVLWSFARGLAELYETASLRRSLRRQREQMREFIEWLTARSLELSDTSMELLPERPPPPEPPGSPDAVTGRPDVEDTRVFGELLTRRELHVLRLLADGHSNSAIAAQLVVTEATVKFHIVNILRKLHVSNRAGAVARYHRLVRNAGEPG